jgi:hypothetical protein
MKKTFASGGKQKMLGKGLSRKNQAELGSTRRRWRRSADPVGRHETGLSA